MDAPTALSAAMQKAQANKTTGSKKTVTVTSSKNPQDIVANLLAARQARLAGQQAPTEQIIHEDAITAFLELGVQEEDLRGTLATLEAGRQNPGEVSVQAINDAIASIQTKIRELEDQRRSLQTAMPKITEAAVKRSLLRQKMTGLGKVLRDLDPAGTAYKDLAEVIAEACKAGALALTAEAEAEVSWGTNGERRHYKASLNDPVVQQFVEALAKFTDEFKAAGEAKRDNRFNEVREFLISTERTAENNNTSALNALRGLPNASRSLGEFLTDPTKEFSFVELHQQSRRTGEDEFHGIAVVERKAGTTQLACIKCTRSSGAHFLFGYFKDGKWTRTGEIKFGMKLQSAEGKPSRLEIHGLRNNLLTTSLNAQFAKEQESQTKRDVSENLRDIANISNPLTFADLRAGEEGVCPVNIQWRHNRDDRRGVWVTFHLEGDGESHFRIYNAVDGTYDKAEWLKPFAENTALEQLDMDRRWLAVRALNTKFERDWQLQRESAKHNATPVTADSVDALCLLKGQDGVYAVKSLYAGRDRKTPTGFLLERRGSTVMVAYAVPGTSERSVRDRQTQESLVGKTYELADLPKPVRALLRNLYRYYHGLGGPEGLTKVPEYLLSPSGETEPQAEAEAEA